MEEQILINYTKREDNILFIINTDFSKKVTKTNLTEKEMQFIDGLKELINNYNAE